MGATETTAEQTHLTAMAEALLFSTDRPLTSAMMAEAIGGAVDGDGDGDNEPLSPGAVEAAIEALNGVYDASGRAFRIERVAGGYRVMTRPEHAGLLASFHKARTSSQLTRAGIETLAVIAYQQPMTRGRLEAIRGVGCGEVLRTLLERRLISVVGRAEELGRPMLYGTTKRFLDVFGIASLRDLPATGKDAAQPDVEGAAHETMEQEAPAGRSDGA